MSRKTWICKYCGSDEVGCDASAYWDVDLQSWEMGDLRDDDWCSNCDGETSMQELYSTEEEFPIETKKAVMVKELSEEGETSNYTIITDETDRIYAVEFAGGETANEVFSPKSIYILTKRDEFHWSYEV